jgi:nucleoside-triphosphatase
MPNNVLVSGKPGSGKTTLLVKLMERAAARGFKADGFVTEEIRKGSSRVGFEVRNLGGESAVLAHIDYKGKPRVGKYGVDVKAFENIALKALDTGKKEADLLVVDEIGRMEMNSAPFRHLLLELMSLPVPLLATIHVGKDNFTVTLLDRGDVTVYHLDTSVRESLLEVIDESLHVILEDRKGSSVA